jgi:hypothetical protein
MIKVGRPPVLVLWGIVVAERLGFERDEALTLGRALIGLGGNPTYRPPDVFAPTPEGVRLQRAKLGPGQKLQVGLMHRAIVVMGAREGLRAMSKGRPIAPHAVEQYLGERFGDDIDRVATAMATLAKSLPPSELATRAFALYEQFRPEKDELDIDRIVDAARRDIPSDERDSWFEDDGGGDSEMPSFRGPKTRTAAWLLTRRAEPASSPSTARHAPAEIVDDAIAPPKPAPVRQPPPPVAWVKPTLARPAPPRRHISVVLLLTIVVFTGGVGTVVGALLSGPIYDRLSIANRLMPAVPVDTPVDPEARPGAAAAEGSSQQSAEHPQPQLDSDVPPAIAPEATHRGEASPELAVIAMRRGNEQMKLGDVIAARRFYEMAAANGMVQAATAVGRTFDPSYLTYIGVRGGLADVEKAREWYEQAASAGDIEARARLARLMPSAATR